MKPIAVALNHYSARVVTDHYIQSIVANFNLRTNGKPFVYQLLDDLLFKFGLRARFCPLNELSNGRGISRVLN